MKAVEFEGQTIVFAKDQPQYKPLPAHVDIHGVVTTCWKMGWRDRVGVLFGGRVWLQLLTFGHPVQPVSLSQQKPEMGIGVIAKAEVPAK